MSFLLAKIIARLFPLVKRESKKNPYHFFDTDYSFFRFQFSIPISLFRIFGIGKRALFIFCFREQRVKDRYNHHANAYRKE